MSKSSVFENKAFQQTAPVGVGFNLIPKTNNFNSIFDTKPLDTLESTKIEKLLEEGFQNGLSEDQVVADIANLKQITAEIKAIGKQGTILMGERVHRAREILKPYKDGTFSRWLESAFGTRKTGYNALSYYELYTALPHDELREGLKKLQQRTAYILASREGDVKIKAQIIGEHYNKSHDELVTLIREKLPIGVGDKRAEKNPIKRILSGLRHNIEKIYQNKGDLTSEDMKEILKLKNILKSLIVENKNVID